MRSLSILAFTAASASAGSVSIPLTRGSHGHSARRLTRRATTGFDLTAVNNITGGGYYATLGIGTPPQTLNFQLDTGSSDTWVNSNQADLCSSQELQQEVQMSCQKTFDSDASSTFDLVDENGFNITYLDGRNILGDYFQDTVTVDGKKVTKQQLGLAFETVRGAGIMGLGFSDAVAARREYPAIVDQMLTQGLINSAAFSLYLNDLDSQAGTILFGAIDSDKYIGDLAMQKLVPVSGSGTNAITFYNVPIGGITATVPKGVESLDLPSLKTDVILDSGSTLCLLPNDVVEPIYDRLGVQVDRTGTPYIDCAYRGRDGEGYAFNFEFNQKTIEVPLRELVIDAFGQDSSSSSSVPRKLKGRQQTSNNCVFGISPSGTFSIDGSFALLGDTFLRSAYVVYDMSNNQVGLAQANLNTSSSNIVEIGTDKKIPVVKGASGQTETPSPSSSSSSSSSPTASSTAESGASSTQSTRTADQPAGSNTNIGDTGSGGSGSGNGNGDDDNAAGRPAPASLGFVAVAAFMGAFGFSLLL